MAWRKPLIIRRIHGHSMVPVLPPKTLVWGWAWTDRYQPGDIVIFQHEGKEKIKRVDHILPDGRLFVVGEHPETSTDSRQFGPIERAAVLAKVIWPHPNPE